MPKPIWLVSTVSGIASSSGRPTGISQIALGNSLRDKGFLLIPEESRSPAVLRRAWMHAVRLARPVTV